MNAVEDAFTRLKIVSAAVEGADVTDLSVAESRAAVDGCLEALVDHYASAESHRGQMIFALAMNAKTVQILTETLAQSNVLKDRPTVEALFSVFCNTFDLLVRVHEEDYGIRDWVVDGIENGWASKPWCYVHDNPPLTDEEKDEIESEDDMDAICITVTRLVP